MRPACVPSSCPGCPHLVGGEFHGRDYFRIGAATAKVTREIVPDLVLIGLGALFEQLARHHHEARGAKAALRGARFKKRLLHWRKLSALREMFDGHDRLAVHECCQIETS